jgi:hypothetical protein
MTRGLNRLTAAMVSTLKKPGRHADGANLYLKVSEGSEAVSKSWVFLYVHEGRQREAELGTASQVSLAEARQKATECRLLLAKGI